MAPVQGDPSRLVAAGVPLATPGEEVAEEDGLYLVLGEGGQRPDEALVVALDIPDDEDRQRHRPRVRGRRAATAARGGRRRPAGRVAGRGVTAPRCVRGVEAIDVHNPGDPGGGRCLSQGRFVYDIRQVL